MFVCCNYSRRFDFCLTPHKLLILPGPEAYAYCMLLKGKWIHRRFGSLLGRSVPVLPVHKTSSCTVISPLGLGLGVSNSSLTEKRLANSCGSRDGLKSKSRMLGSNVRVDEPVILTVSSSSGFCSGIGGGHLPWASGPCPKTFALTKTVRPGGMFRITETAIDGKKRQSYNPRHRTISVALMGHK